MNKKWLSLLIVLGLLFGAPTPTRANPGVLRAAPDGVTNGDCDSWANACTLQYALSQAVSGDEIWVKAGVHYPGAAGNRTATFTLKNGVALYGGFAGTETMRDQRNWQVNKTILSGDIDQNDTNTDRNNIAETWNDIQGANAYHVVTGSSTDNTTVLDGFVITAGQANGSPWPKNIGGGMYNFSSSPTLTNVTFSGNSAGFGGGMGNESSSPTLTNVTFNGNSASYGGGMENYFSSNPRLTNVTFSGNSAGSAGGGMDNERSSPTLTNVTFSGNTANFGGGMENYNSSNLTLTNVTFSGNSAAVYMKGKWTIMGIILIMLLLALAVGLARAQGPDSQGGPSVQAATGTAFTYQGQLKKDGSPVNGTCDFQFSLWDAAGSGSPPIGGNPIGITQTATISVTNGLFTAQIDFGADAFQGDARWLAPTSLPSAGVGPILPVRTAPPLVEG
jgi:hypothetical protein